MSEQKLQQHLMFDIETLATVPNAIVLSVGAVLFTKEGIVDKFYVNLSMKEQLDKGRAISESTFYWWMQQSQEASAALTKDVFAVRAGLGQLWHWMNHTCQIDMKHVKVWGNGATFDNVIMRDILKQYGYSEEYMWRFWNDRCHRTYVAENNIEKVKPTVAHDALADAAAQAHTLINYWNK